MVDPSQPTGLLHTVLLDGAVFRRLLALVGLGVVLLVGGVGLGVPYLGDRLGLQPSVLEISGNPRVILERRTAEGKEFVLAVHPQDWNETRIQVEPGDSVEILAHGRVNISVNGVAESSRIRHEVEARLRREYRESHGGAEPDSTWLPERHYSEADRQAIRPSRLWTDPNGYPGPLVDHRYPRRTRGKILPAEPYGLLVGAISAERPTRTDLFANAFSVGRDATIPSWSGRPGYLWLIVNDVWDDDDPDFPEKFYIDNIGYFVVTVRVQEG